MSLYTITIKSGIDTVEFEPAEYTIDYDSLARADSGRNADGSMVINFIKRKLTKLTIKLPPHKFNDSTYAKIISYVQGQKVKVSYFDYLSQTDITEKEFYCSQTSVRYSFKDVVEDISFELIDTTGDVSVNHVTIPKYTITVNNSDVLSGFTRGSGEFVYGEKIQIDAIPNEHYHFVSWNDGNTDNPRTITVTGNATYTANIAIDTYTVSVASDPHAVFTGTGTYGWGSTATITCIPDAGYMFTAWSDGNTSNPRYITVTDNVYLSATVAMADAMWIIPGSNGTLTFTRKAGSSTYSKNIEYSFDLVNWTTLPLETAVSITGHEPIFFKDYENTYSTAGYGFSVDVPYSVNGKLYAIFGNQPGALATCSYLFYYETNLTYAKDLDFGNMCIYGRSMFEGCTNLQYGPDKLSTYYFVPNDGYKYMFRSCTNLLNAPELPATTVRNNGYAEMFGYCEKLVTPPVLPALDVGKQGYEYMFRDCKLLATAPALPAETLGANCYAFMFSGCEQLVTPPALPATNISIGCYQGMFYMCKNLTSAPALPALELQSGCYAQMFYNCLGLTTAPALPATILADNCYNGMFSQCYYLTTAPALPATTSAPQCYAFMFSTCTSLRTIPAINLTTLAEKSCYCMFAQCISIAVNLTQSGVYPNPYRIPATGTGTTTAVDWGQDMFAGTDPAGTAPTTPDLNTTYYTNATVI